MRQQRKINKNRFRLENVQIKAVLPDFKALLNALVIGIEM